MFYNKIKRVGSHGYLNHIPDFRKRFPELSRVRDETLEERFRLMGVMFYEAKRTPIKLWIRFTLPFAALLFLIMLISLPINFLVTGRWTYSLSPSNHILNWFKSLGIE